MEKVKKCFNLRNIIFIIAVIYMWLFFYTRILNDNNELIITTSTITLFVIFIFIQVLFFLIYRYLCKKNVSINKIYLILAFSFLPFYLFVFPQDQIPDEINDYNRALEISMGHLTSESRGESGAVNPFLKRYLIINKKDSDIYCIISLWKGDVFIICIIKSML